MKRILLLLPLFLLLLPLPAAVRVDATGDRLNRTTSLPTYNACTIMAWFKLSADRNKFSTFMQLDSAVTKMIVGTTADGTTLSIFNGVGTVTGSALTVGTWYHIAMVCDGIGGADFLCYLNGVENMTGGGVTGTSTDLIFCQSDDGAADEWIDGCIAAAKVYDAILTPAEIANEMRSYRPLRTAGLNAWYPCVSIAADEIDFSGGGRNLTIGGTLATEQGPPIAWK